MPPEKILSQQLPYHPCTIAGVCVVADLDNSSYIIGSFTDYIYVDIEVEVMNVLRRSGIGWVISKAQRLVVLCCNAPSVAASKADSQE